MGDQREWRFPVVDKQRTTMIEDPIQGEFFTTVGVGAQADALVRETVQNSMDAGAVSREGNGAVRICFTFRDRMPFMTRKYRAYTNCLEGHLRGRGTGLRETPSLADDDMRMLLIEDYGTTGLEGDVDEIEPSQGAPHEHSFYYFWRNMGRSSKSDQAMGRWGVGKSVYPASSRINAFWGVTLQRSTRARYMMGLCVLKTHYAEDGRWCQPYGHYARYTDDGGFPHAVSEDGHIARFCRAFELSRDDEPGLSLVIPFVDKDITKSTVVEALLHQYFHLIVTGRLEASVASPTGQVDLYECCTTPALLQSYVHRPNGAVEVHDLPGVLEFAKWASDLSEDEFRLLATPQKRRGGRPDWGGGYEPLDEEKLEEARERFAAGERMAFRVPISVARKGDDARGSYFHVFVERVLDRDSQGTYFVRNGMTVTDAAKRLSLPEGVRCLVVVDDEPLAALVGDSENPAHTEWQHNSAKFKSKYKHGADILKFVKHAPRQLVNHLRRPTQAVDKTLLESVFSVDEVSDDGKTDPVPIGSNDGTGDSEHPRINLERRKRLVRITRVEGGFSVRVAADYDGDMPRSLRVEVAYDRRRGNPFGRFSPLDFDLTDVVSMDVRVSGAKEAARTANSITLTDLTKQTAVVVCGFDTSRDIKVRTRKSGDERA